MAKEEKLLAALLNANQELVDVFKCYHESEVAANAEEEKRGNNLGGEEQKAGATVCIFLVMVFLSISDFHFDLKLLKFKSSLRGI